MLDFKRENITQISICFVAFIFPLIVFYRGVLLTFINTGSLAIYWLVVPLIISLGVILKYKSARWFMIFWLYLVFFYELIGTNTGMTACVTSPLLDSLFYGMIYLLFISILSSDTSYNLFHLDKNMRIHEVGAIGLSAFSIIYFDMIYYWFLV